MLAKHGIIRVHSVQGPEDGGAVAGYLTLSEGCQENGESPTFKPCHVTSLSNSPKEVKIIPNARL